MTEDFLQFPLGRIVQHDPRSRGFALPESDLRKLSSKKWERYVPIFDQGDLGSCTGNACLGALGTGPLYNSLRSIPNPPSFTQEQAIEIYSLASAIDQWPGQYPPDDTGSSGLAVAKVAQEKGWLDSYYHAFSFNAALTALQTGPAITGVSWYTSFFYPSFSGECSIAEGSYPAGGHEIVVDQIDVENQRVWFTNSWGILWGRAGRAWFSFDTWERLLNEYGDVTQLFPIKVENPIIPPEDPDHDGCLAALAGPWATKVVNQLWRSKKDRQVAQAVLTWTQAKNLSF